MAKAGKVIKTVLEALHYKISTPDETGQILSLKGRASFLNLHSGESMSFFEIGLNDSLYFEYEPPSGNQSLTFVFINAITGDTGMWQAEIGPTLRDAGYGTLAFNFRGQAKSTASEGLAFDEALITGDLIRLLQHLNPPNPVLVGLSIGGLY